MLLVHKIGCSCGTSHHSHMTGEQGFSGRILQRGSPKFQEPQRLQKKNALEADCGPMKVRYSSAGATL